MIRDLKEERLRIIDELLSSHTIVIDTIYAIQRIVNNRLKEVRPAESESLFRNLLTDLKRLLPKDIEIINPRKETTKRWKAGYCYSDAEYSYFKEEKTQEQEAKELLLFATGLFSAFKDTPMMEEFNQLAQKLLEDGKSAQIITHEQSQRIIQVESGVRNSGTQWLKTLYKAIQRKNNLKMRYEKLGGEETTRRISPYLLKEYRNRWYVVAYDHTSTHTYKTNVFALNCINDLQASSSTYYRDPAFDIENYFKYSLGIWHNYYAKPIKVQLKFTEAKDIDDVRSSLIHHSQKTISKTKNTLTVEIEVYDTPELNKLIKSYGSEVQVISPASLAKKIKASAQRVVDLY